MGLNAVLKDRARIVKRTPLPQKVAGKTVSVESTLPWFRARLELPSGNESAGPGDRRRVVTVPTLMLGTRDSEGGVIVVTARDQLEVDSPQLGHHLWEITVDPAPMRKKARVIGWTLTLQRVEDHEFTERLAS